MRSMEVAKITKRGLCIDMQCLQPPNHHHLPKEYFIGKKNI